MKGVAFVVDGNLVIQPQVKIRQLKMDRMGHGMW